MIPGGFGTRGVEGKIAAAQWARTNEKPLLGICLGLQCAVIEFARNVLNKQNAHTTEIDPDTLHPVVIDMPEHNSGQMGGTMRLGKRQTIFKTEDSVMRKLYGNKKFVEERHRHRYEVNPAMVEEFEKAGMMFVGHDADATRYGNRNTYIISTFKKICKKITKYFELFFLKMTAVCLQNGNNGTERTPLLRCCTISSRIFVKANEAIATLYRSDFGCYRKT